MNVPELIRRKRQGMALSPEDLQAFIDGYVGGAIPDYQVSAFLMAVFFQGMTPAEAAGLTRSMLHSGETFDLSDIEGPKVDKHSTGGVGDKVSLILAPLAAAAGAIVPMVSGRGLGHTGGTLDKLDSIPGYRWGLSQEEFKGVLRKAGCSIIGQTENFVPADKKLYALRDVTATVESVPLISGSILSKKVAAGVESLVMDVKCGSGAFMDNRDAAMGLADSLVRIGRELGKNMSAVLTQMSQPLGEAIGNALEVRETIALLKDEGPADARDVTLELTAEMLVISGLEPDLHTALQKLTALIRSGAALEKFKEWIEAQGGDPRVADDPGRLEVSGETHQILAPRAGIIAAIATRDLGVAANTLGAGRLRTTDTVDTTVGMMTHAKVGDAVEAGQPLATLYHRGGRGLEEASHLAREAYTISDEPVAPLRLILDRVN